MTLWIRLAAACMFFALSRDAAAQSATSTKTGVYSREQALRGQDIYAGNCKNCHTPESHTGQLFNAKWQGKKLSELYAYIRDQMPKNAPGSLEPQEYVDVLAYVLRINRMPMGADELPADDTALKAIRIERTSMPVRKDP